MGQTRVLMLIPTMHSPPARIQIFDAHASRVCKQIDLVPPKLQSPSCAILHFTGQSCLIGEPYQDNVV